MPASDERRYQALILAPIQRVRRRLNAVRWTEAGVAPVWSAATACVLARLLLGDFAPWVLPLPLIAAGAWWLVRARARSVSLTHAAVLADRSAGAGGLLLTRLERPVGEWELSANQLARAVTLPEVRWRRPVGALLAALGFLVVGFLLPRPSPRLHPVNAAAAAKVAAVQAQAEALSHEAPADPAVDAELRRLAQEVAEGRFDSADWEATDTLGTSLESRAAQAAAQLAAAAQAAKQLEDSLGAATDAEAVTQEREALERALMGLGHAPSAQSQQGQDAPSTASGQGNAGAADGDGGTASGSAQTASGSAHGTPRSRDEVAQLRQTLERRQRELEKRFGQGQGSRPGEQGEGDGEGEGQERSASSGHVSHQVGKGTGAGVSRGGDTAPLVFGDKAQMDPERLAFKPLPKGQGGDAEGLWGLSAAEPRPHEGSAGAGAQGTGARGEAEAGHAAGPLLPRNRELVKRYFGGEP